MAGFFKDMKSKASHAMGLDAKDELKDTQDQLAESQKELENLKKAYAELQLELSKERSECVDLQNTLESIEAEKEAEAAENQQKQIEEAQAAMQQVAMEQKEQEEAREHCQMAYDAMKGLTTDDKKLAQALCPHKISHVQYMKKLYLTNFGKDLVAHVKKNTGGNFRTFLLGILDAPEEYVAKLLRSAVKGLTTDNDILVEILAPATNDEVKSFKETYQKLFDRDLQADVTKSTSGDLKKILTVILQGSRNEGGVDPAKIAADVEALFSAGQGKTFGTDFEPFLQILGNRSCAQVAAIDEGYKEKNKKEKKLSELLSGQFSGHVLKALEAMLLAHANRPVYYATVVNSAWKGIGCDDVAVMRVLLSRREKDLMDIIEAYNTPGLHKQPFVERMKSEVSSDVGRASSLLLTGSM